MKPRTAQSFGHGLGAALVLSLSGAAALAVLTPLVGAGIALRAVIALLGLAYVLYVIGASGERIGRVTTIVLWAAVATAAWLSGVPFVGYVLIHVGMIWLVRSLYFYSGVLPALLDLGLSALGIAFAAWAATRSGSALLALWCFFLVQAFHVVVGAAIANGQSALTSDGDDPDHAFNRAQRAAEAALRRMSATR